MTRTAHLSERHREESWLVSSTCLGSLPYCLESTESAPNPLRLAVEGWGEGGARKKVNLFD